MRIKRCPVRIKAAGTHEGTDEGQFEALVSVFGNRDSYGDVVMPGAFTDTLAEWTASGDPIPVYWSHRMDDPDYNIGHVLEAKETDDGLWVRAQLDMDAPKAQQVYRLLKGRRVTQFSFAYDIIDSAFVEEQGEDPRYELRKVKLYEVGPTPIGANQDTDLLAVKAAGRDVRVELPGATAAESAAIRAAVETALTTLAAGGAAKKAIPAHKTATDDGSWDGPANEKRLPADAGAATLRKAYAWVDPDADPDTKAAYRFIHHLVDADGAVGAASVKACQTGIAVLNGGRGGTTIPDADREGVYRHLAKHLSDAGVEAPDLKSAPDPDTTAIDEVLDDAEVGPEFFKQFAAMLAPHLRDALAGAGTTSSNGTGSTATPTQPAASEEPAGAKGDEPARSGTASLRLRTDLASLEAEVLTLTN